MIHTILYQNNGQKRFKNVQADTEEEARELLKQELRDIYSEWCERKNIQFTEEKFNKRYKI